MVILLWIIRPFQEVFTMGRKSYALTTLNAFNGYPRYGRGWNFYSKRV